MHTEDPLCNHQALKDLPIRGVGHHVRAKTNVPIIGVLTQPIPDASHGDSQMWRNEFDRIKSSEFEKLTKKDPTLTKEEVFPNQQFIESSHVQYLEAAGARVVPIDWTRPVEELNYMLENINGLYIPGDSKSLVQGENVKFTDNLRKIMKWAQLHNEQEFKHFPVLAVGYGFLSLMKSQMSEETEFDAFKASKKLQQNLAHDPTNTFLYDDYDKATLDQLFDKINFFSNVECSLSLEQMILENKVLSGLFMPVTTFDDAKKDN